jgi:hypothetical protein
MINNYRFGSYAILAMGLINLRYQTGNTNNLNNSSVLIALGLIGLLFTFIPKLNYFLANKFVKFIALILLAFAIAYGFLI